MADSHDTQTLPNPQSAIERRRFLTMAGGLAAAAAAAGVVAVQAAKAAPAVQENPELLRLGEQLPGVSSEYHDALASYRLLVAEWGPRWPNAPESLRGGWGDIERDLTGFGIKRDGRTNHLCTADIARNVIDDERRALRRKNCRRRAEREAALSEWDAILSDAERYETEKARILDASGYPAADDRLRAAEQAFVVLLTAVMETPDWTMRGTLIKAHALAAGGDTAARLLFMAIPKGSGEWSWMLAASIMRRAPAEVAS